MIGPAFIHWALNSTGESNFDSLPEEVQRARVSSLKERLTRYGEDFDIRVSGDLRHGAQCRLCKTFVCGTRSDLSVIERDMQSHVCLKVVEHVDGNPLNNEIANLRIVDGPTPRFFSGEELESMVKVSINKGPTDKWVQLEAANLAALVAKVRWAYENLPAEVPDAIEAGEMMGEAMTQMAEQLPEPSPVPWPPETMMTVDELKDTDEPF